MNHRCVHCGTELSGGWDFCPHCGRHIEDKHGKQEPLEHENAPDKGGYSGLTYGFIAMPILLILGTMICFTGWGLFIGVPIILLGIFAPLAGTMFGIAEQKGKCPKCGMRVLTGPDHLAHACPHCGVPFAVNDKGIAAVH
ncbi:MAG TPA: zinc-ribbon domain-containing protein [Terracidiphilus sp.]|jgi:predicted amidophosphoribosyltransferase|nr:zinc-ribbon domain-containing protein [Terracidiphilus sp.]